MDFLNNTPETGEYAALKSYVDKATGLENAIKEFTAKDASTATREKLRRSWDAILLLASETDLESETQDDIVKFLTAILDCDRSITNDAKDSKEGNQVSWSKVPGFKDRVQELYTEFSTPENGAEKEDAIHCQNNITALLARLTSSSSQDFSFLALKTLASALESSSTLPGPVIQRAAIWILYCGPHLRTLSHENKNYDTIVGPGDKWPGKEWKGFEVDRWIDWEHRFKNVSEVHSDEGTRALAKKTRRYMADLAGQK